MHNQKSIYHLLARLFVALFAAHFIVVHSAEETWAELFTKAYYYKSLLYSIVIAVLLIEYIYMVSKLIDHKYVEHKVKAKRIRHQILYGFCIAAVHTFLMAMVLFWINGESIFNSTYFEKLYVFILLFIFAINVVYTLYFDYLKIPKLRYQMIKIDYKPLEELRIEALSSNLPAVVYHENKTCFAVDFNGVKTGWPNTIAESIVELRMGHYFQINRKVIVHRAAIVSFSPYQLKCLKIAVNMPCPIELITSRRKTGVFKEWLAV